jgi:hypothetical protein
VNILDDNGKPTNQIADHTMVSPIRMTDDHLPPKNKSRFSTGFNAGQRHVRYRGKPPAFDVTCMSGDFQCGYVYGVVEARSGSITDNLACGKRIEFCWTIYEAGGLPPMDAKLP